MGSDFRILGELEVRQDGTRIKLGSPRQRALLIRLLISPGELVTTDRLVEDLWHGDPPETAWHMVHVYVSRLRKALCRDGARLERRGTGYCFSIEPGELDVPRFEHLATEGRAALARHDADGASVQLREALNLWRGPALAEFADEEFAREEAVRLNELKLATLEQRMWADLELGRHGEVVEELQDLANQHPFRETFWEQLMLALYRSGRQADALRSYQMARANLVEQLGLDPGPALRRMEERILAHDPSLEPARTVDASLNRHEMPLQRTSFVGRERELAQAAELLERSRLLTLTGAPGSGKTRLALRLATDHQDGFPDGSFFVPLAPVTNPRFFDGTVARTLGLREVPGETALDGVKGFLRHRRVLVILDNFEQILPAAPQIGELLDAAPHLTIMVTSRAPLGISGEQELPVPPLGVPSVDRLPDLEALAGYDAVALFVVRARAADPSFELNAGNAAAVAEITICLDGLPLAIELAAARIKLLPPQDLLRRLEQRLTVLTGGPADAVDRHRTMRDAIAWSYELLDPEKQALFRRLGVLRGGFTLKAATAVADLPNMDIVDGVGWLLSKSLLYRPVDVGQARFVMLEMIREFALEKLASAGEDEESSDRHARYFLSLAEEIEAELTQEAQRDAIGVLSQEIDNIRGALQHALDAHEPDLGLLLAGSIWRFWQSCDQFTEGREWLESLLAQPGASDEVRAKGLTALAGLAYWQADYDEALARYDEALNLYRAAGDRFNEADTLYGMSLTANWNGDHDTGERLAEVARLLFEELGSKEGLGKALMAQGFSLWKRADHAAALLLYERSTAIARECGDSAMATTTLLGVASLTFHLGERTEAMKIIMDVVEEATESRNAHIAVWALDLVAAFAASALPERAVRLAGAVDFLREEAGGGFLPQSLGIEDARSAAGRLLSPESLEQSWEQGRGMGLEEAVAHAHELDDLISTP